MAAVMGALVVVVVQAGLGLALCQLMQVLRRLLVLVRLGQQQRLPNAAAVVAIVYFRQSQAQAAVAVVEKIRDSAPVAAAAAAAAHGMQPQAAATRLLHLQVKATTAEQVPALVEGTMGAVVVEHPQLVLMLLLMCRVAMVVMAMRHRLSLAV